MSVSASAPVIPVTRTSSPRPRPAQDALGFGKYFADHMLVVDYTEGQGWHDARIVPYGTLQLDPAAAVLHYAQAMFEGLKAYRLADGTQSASVVTSCAMPCTNNASSIAGIERRAAPVAIRCALRSGRNSDRRPSARR